MQSSKNGTFLFNRQYMDYHSDRFTDHSLLARNDNRLVAVLPANIAGDEIVSHGGLTFGGWITDNSMRAALMLQVMQAMKSALSGVARRLVYKAVPFIYHKQPAQEDQYALWLCGARLVRRDVASAVRLRDQVPLSDLRVRCIRRASIRKGVWVVESDDLLTYHRLLSTVLMTRHNAVPVHSPRELALLQSRFPDQIRLFAAYLHGEMVAGALCFDNGWVAHTQYLACSDVGRENGALDLVLYKLATEYFPGREYLSFGISTESAGRYLNEGLIAHKEGFGARSFVHDFYELELD